MSPFHSSNNFQFPSAQIWFALMTCNPRKPCIHVMSVWTHVHSSRWTDVMGIESSCYLTCVFFNFGNHVHCATFSMINSTMYYGRIKCIFSIRTGFTFWLLQMNLFGKRLRFQKFTMATFPTSSSSSSSLEPPKVRTNFKQLLHNKYCSYISLFLLIVH